MNIQLLFGMESWFAGERDEEVLVLSPGEEQLGLFEEAMVKLTLKDYYGRIEISDF